MILTYSDRRVAPYSSDVSLRNCFNLNGITYPTIYLSLDSVDLFVVSVIACMCK